MDVAQLVTNIIETMDGAIEFTEYALARVLLPDEYKIRFQNRTDIVLAFDYEVAEEHPEAEFITFGSETLENLIDIALNTPMSDVRYAVIDRIDVANPEERISRSLALKGRSDVAVLSKRVLMGIWSVFVFRARYISSESFEEERQIWVNMLTGMIDTVMPNYNVFFEREALYTYPYANVCAFSDAYSTAAAHMSKLTSETAENIVSPIHVVRETERIESYYKDLIAENGHRLSRKGLTAENELAVRAKHKALLQEKERQINEIRENMIPRTSVYLAHGITIHVPVVELVCNIGGRQGNEQRTFYYECLTKQLIDAPV